MQLVSGRKLFANGSGLAVSPPSKGLSNLLDRLRRQPRSGSLGNGDQKRTLSDQANTGRLRFDLDPSCLQPNGQGQTRPKSGTFPNLLGDHESAGGIDGGFHGI